MRFWNVFVLVLAFASPLWSQPPAPASPAVPNSASDPISTPAPDSPPALNPTPLPIPATDRGAEAGKLIESGQFDAAQKFIASGLAVAPRDPEWVTLLAEVRIGQGREREAVKLLAAANQLGGVTALRSMLTGVAECIWNRTDLAEPEFRTAVQMDPFNPVPHYFLARLLYSQKRFEEAIQESKNAFSLAPGFVRAYENLGLCYEGERKPEEAERWYLEAMRRDATGTKKTEWPALDLGSMLIRENRLNDAKSYLEQALAINPKNPKTLQQMGLLRERTGDFKGALVEFQSAIDIDPKMETAYYQASRMSRELGQTDQAMKYLNKFTELHESNKLPLKP